MKTIWTEADAARHSGIWGMEAMVAMVVATMGVATTAPITTEGTEDTGTTMADLSRRHWWSEVPPLSVRNWETFLVDFRKNLKMLK